MKMRDVSAKEMKLKKHRIFSLRRQELEETAMLSVRGKGIAYEAFPHSQEKS